MPSKLILIVDDDVDVRFVFAAILNDDGYRVIEAPNGERAIQYAARFQPDLVLMDLRMPVMDGLTAAELIRADEMTRSIPILLITTSELSASDKDRAGKVFEGSLSKPLAPLLVVEAVTRLIGPPG